MWWWAVLGLLAAAATLGSGAPPPSLEEPVLHPRNWSHILPPDVEESTEGVLLDGRTLNRTLTHWTMNRTEVARRLRKLGRRLHVPPLVDKALRLLNLQQVVQEVETSVMSKVSCTACKAGKYRIFVLFLTHLKSFYFFLVSYQLPIKV